MNAPLKAARLRPKIIIVEDQTVMALDLETRLTAMCYDVSAIVESGEKAIEKAETDCPDLILMDVSLTGNLDGIDTARILRQRKQIPIIFISAYVDDERLRRARTTEPFGYVLKPLEDLQLKSVIELALYKAKAEAKRRQVATAGKKARRILVDQVKKRTTELQEVNARLKQEVADRWAAMEDKQQALDELAAQSKRLEETNTALKVLLEYREIEKHETQENLSNIIRKLVEPLLEKLSRTQLDHSQKVLINIIKTSLTEIFSPAFNKLSSVNLGLTPSELEVANLVKHGKTTKEIAEILHISDNAVRFHRQNIRAKLGVKKKKVNLRIYLQHRS